jgi:hypothetical protein
LAVGFTALFPTPHHKEPLFDRVSATNVELFVIVMRCCVLQCLCTKVVGLWIIDWFWGFWWQISICMICMGLVTSAGRAMADATWDHVKLTLWIPKMV